jgi:outer membrane protein assembly factor BamA
MFCILFAGCFPTRHLKENEHLVTKVKIKSDKNNHNDELENYIKQQPNKKILGVFRLKLHAYFLINQEKLIQKKEKQRSQLEAKNKIREDKGKKLKKEHRLLREWVLEDIGEEPVIFNPFLSEKTAQQMTKHLFNKGYYHAKVSDTTYFKRKKAIVTYQVNYGEPYTIRRIIFSINDTLLYQAIKNSSKKTLIKPSQNYDIDILEAERVRLEKALKNQGYFAFTREYIYFEVDSNLLKNKIDLKIVIKNPVSKDSLITLNHQKYTLHHIYINSNYNPNKIISLDTIVFKDLYFLTSPKHTFRPEVIAHKLLIKPNQLFNLDNVEISNNRLASFKTFKFINISFKEFVNQQNQSMLDCEINLVPSPRKSITTELGATTNRITPLGISGGIVFRNKNTFKGAELFELKLFGGIEAQRQIVDNEVKKTTSNFFNTIEFAPQLSLNIPKLFIPFKDSPFPKLVNQRTSVILAYNFQKRLDFQRDVLALKLNYQWKGEGYATQMFQPFDLSFVKIDKSPAFEEMLTKSNNRLLQNAYRNQLLAASGYSFTFNNQDANKFRNFIFIKGSFEAAGNMLRAIHKLAGAELNDNGGYELLGIQFAQYVKPELDLRLYKNVNAKTKVVYRLFTGVGIPLSNLSSLPFDKSYFGGGVNGIRAWTARTLGPGSLSDTALAVVDQIGDIQIEANIEYRFKLLKMLEGAAFLDMGNIWLQKYDPKRPGGEFEFNDFYKETAIGFGLGARFDFSFLIIRLDFATQLKNPSLVETERWFFQSKELTNQARLAKHGIGYEKYAQRINVNFGIGYPF